MSYTPQPLDTLAPNTFVAGPNSGAPGIPGARALMPSDLPGHQHGWNEIIGTPDTLNGYGITDAAPKNNAALTGTPTTTTPDAAVEVLSSPRIANVAFCHAIYTYYFQSSIVNIGTAGNTNVINIGTGSGAKLITIGGPLDEVRIGGNLTYIQATSLEVTDKTIIVNKGGAAATGATAGLGVEEGGSITAYFQVNGARDGWDLKAPGRAGVVRFVTPNNNSLVEHVTLATVHRVYTYPDKDITVAGIDSPDFTGTPQSVTPTAGDNSRKIATTAFTATALAQSGFGPTASVGLSMPSSVFAVANTPVTTTGTLAVTFVPQAKGLMLASPAGATGLPVFRAIVNSDLPLSGASAGSYTKVTVDDKGIVTTGSNPTTLVGYGITDAAPKVNADLTGTPTADTPAAADNTRRIATTAWTRALISTSNPAMNGSAIPGSSGSISDAAHVHPSDTSRVKATGVPELGGGLLASRPAAGVAGRLWAATDDWVIYRDNGTGWEAMLPALTGDITTVKGAKATTLANAGTAGTYSKVVTDAKGRVISGSMARSKSAIRFYYENLLDVNDKQPAMRVDAAGIITAVRYFRDNTVSPTAQATIEIRKNGVLAYSCPLGTGDAHRTWITLSNTDVAVADGDTITAVVIVAGTQVSGITLQCDLELDTN